MANSHDTVAHAWAHRRALKGSNMFTDGETVYSYGRHFAIAKHYISPKGVSFVAYNTQSYSQSTSKHQFKVRRAIPSYTQIIGVPEPLATPQEWIAALLEGIEALAGMYKRARTQKDWYLSTMQSKWNDIQFIAQQYDLEAPDGDLDLDELESLFAARAEHMRAAEAEHQRRRAEIMAQQEIANAEQIEAWLRGVGNRCPYTLHPRLRIRDAHIETSWGAEVPLSVAPMLWKLVTEDRDVARHYVKIHPSVGNYHLDDVLANGDIVVGCHTIPYSELARIAEQLGYAVHETA